MQTETNFQEVEEEYMSEIRKLEDNEFRLENKVIKIINFFIIFVYS